MTNLLFDPVFYRTYSRTLEDGSKESFDQVKDRVIKGLDKLGNLTKKEKDLIRKHFKARTAFPSGRYMWIGGTEWAEQQGNFYGAYNCNSTEVNSFEDMAQLMNLAMQGTGTGAVLEKDSVAKLPPIVNEIRLKEVVPITLGSTGGEENTELVYDLKDQTHYLIVGDSRRGWYKAFEAILHLATSKIFSPPLDLVVDLSQVRDKGQLLKGFGGVANPAKLEGLFPRMVKILNRVCPGQLSPLDVCLLLDEAALVVVAGNVRRSAGMRQYSSDDLDFGQSKMNLWTQDSEGNWKINPELDSLRMANHTAVYHYKPSLDEVKESVKNQFLSGEGAIQYVPEAIARANADLFPQPYQKWIFQEMYSRLVKDYGLEKARTMIKPANMSDGEWSDRVHRYGLNPCLTGDTLVLTEDGHFPIEQLVGKKAVIHDGYRWHLINNFRVTGTEQSVYEVTLNSGEVIKATKNHTFILENGIRKTLLDLQPGDRLLTGNKRVQGRMHMSSAYLKGFLCQAGVNAGGDILLTVQGNEACLERLVASAKELATWNVYFGEPSSVTKERKMFGIQDLGLLPWVSLHKKSFPLETLNLTDSCKLDFLAGLLDGGGIARNNSYGIGYQLKSVSEKWIEGFQAFLKTIGLESKRDYLSTVEGVGSTNIRTYRLTISQPDTVKAAQMLNLSRLQSFAHMKVRAQVKPLWNKVKHVEFSHVAEKVYCCTVPVSSQFQLSNGVITGNCGEIIGHDFMCNLSEVHLNQLAGQTEEKIDEAFYTAGLITAILLHHEFDYPKFKKSRDLDPIVGVSFTGLFDFLVHKFGVDWLKWWSLGRPDDYHYSYYYRREEARLLRRWKEFAIKGVTDYCVRNGLKVPNRVTTVQPAGSKSLLTGASPGWHPPKGSYFIRRITFEKNHPVALACLDLGYSVVPGQNDTDKDGNLLNDPFAEECTEWLIEIPCKTVWADLEGADQCDPSRFSALAQFDFYMQVQKHYTEHNTSATLELEKSEINELATAIHEEMGRGYIAAAILARFHANETYPRLPFEPIDRDTYDTLVKEVQQRKVRDIESFDDAYRRYLHVKDLSPQSPAPCDSDRCLIG